MHDVPARELSRESFIAMVLRNPVNRVLLERLPVLGLKDAWLVAGCLFQTVWNVLSGRPPTEGIADYDIFYFDAGDLSWEAEDREIRRIAEAFRDVKATIQPRNQARVHLWYAERFGPGYPQLRSSRDGIDRFLVAATCVGIQATRDGLEIYAPYGLASLGRGTLRPNPSNYRPDLYAAKAASYRARWPWLRVIPAQSHELEI